MTLNARALDQADARDRERAQGEDARATRRHSSRAQQQHSYDRDAHDGWRAGVQGVPAPTDEATIAANLRDAGAVVIAKTNMTEAGANWIATGMPGNYNVIAGYGFNPYDPRADPREDTSDGRPALNAGGSSSGAGTAANFWAANVGTETSGSILTPANQTMLVGIKPTVGRVSRYGIIPITADQDTAGPMAQDRGGCGAAARRARRPRAGSVTIPRRRACPRVPNGDYTRFLNRARARGRASSDCARSRRSSTKRATARW